MADETPNPNPEPDPTTPAPGASVPPEETEPQAPEQSEPVIVYKAAGYDSVQVVSKMVGDTGMVHHYARTFHRGEVIPSEYLDEDEIDRLTVLGAIEPVDLPAD